MGKKSRKKAKDHNKHGSVHMEKRGAHIEEMGMDILETSLWCTHKFEPGSSGVSINPIGSDDVPSSVEHFDISEENLFGNIDISDLGKVSATKSGHIDKVDGVEDVLGNMEILDLDEILETGYLDILFLQAVERNDLSTVKSLLQQGVNPTTTNDKGENLFHIAARQGYADMVEHFSCGINKPKSPQARNEDIDILRFLVSAQDKDGNKPAQTAAKHNKHDVVSLLLSLPGPYDMVLNDYLISNYSEVLKIGSPAQQILAGLKMFHLLKQAGNPEAFGATLGLSRELAPIMHSFTPLLSLPDGELYDADRALKAMPKCKKMLGGMMIVLSMDQDKMTSEMQKSSSKMIEKSMSAIVTMEKAAELMPSLFTIHEDITPVVKSFKNKLEEVKKILKPHNLGHITRDKETANKVLWGLNALEQGGIKLLTANDESLKPDGKYMKKVFNSLFKEYIRTFCVIEEATKEVSFDPEEIRSQIYEFCSDATALIGGQKIDEIDLLEDLFFS